MSKVHCRDMGNLSLVSCLQQLSHGQSSACPSHPCYQHGKHSPGMTFYLSYHLLVLGKPACFFILHSLCEWLTVGKTVFLQLVRQSSPNSLCFLYKNIGLCGEALALFLAEQLLRTSVASSSCFPQFTYWRSSCRVFLSHFTVFSSPAVSLSAISFPWIASPFSPRDITRRKP